jgi:hypothetical protein
MELSPMSAVEHVKEVADLIRKFNDIDLNRRILNLETEVIDLTRDKRRADERIEVLEKTLKLQKELKFKAPFYWSEGDATPHCPACWEARLVAVHVVNSAVVGGHRHLRCPACKESFPKTQVGF